LRQRVCIRRCHRSPIDFLRGPTSTSRTHATVQPFPGRPPLGRLTNDRRNHSLRLGCTRAISTLHQPLSLTKSSPFIRTTLSVAIRVTSYKARSVEKLDAKKRSCSCDSWSSATGLGLSSIATRKSFQMVSVGYVKTSSGVAGAKMGQVG
jgi:hypothetical protein